MATVRFTGNAPEIAQVDTLTVGGTVEIGDKFICTMNGKTLSVSATTTSTSTTASEIATAWNALSSAAYPEFAEVTALAASATVILTADTAGKPFTVTVSTTESDGSAADAQTFTKSSTTTNSGPADWAVAANWSGGAVPVNSDDVIIENTSQDILYSLDQSAVTLTSLAIKANYTGKLGLPKQNPGGYNEYRTDFLAIGATTITIGEGPGSGSGRIKLNQGAAQTAVTVRNTGSSVETGLPALLWKGTHASNLVSVFKGSVGVAVFGGETATIATLRVDYVSNVSGDADVRLGSGVTLTTITKPGGTLEVNSNATTITHLGGTLHHISGTITTLTIDGGEVYSYGVGTITTINVGSGAKADFGRAVLGITVTNCNLYEKGTLLDPNGRVTFSNGIVCVRTDLPNVTLNVGHNRTLTPS